VNELEENVDRLVRRWADPVPEDQVDRACREFVDRVGRDGPAAPGNRWTVVAASLLVVLPVLWAVFSPRGPQPADPIPSPALVQEDPEKKVSRLITRLQSDTPEERDAAMEELRKLGPDAVPHLKRVLQETKDAEVRARLESLLPDIDLPNPAVVFAGRFGGREKRLMEAGGNRSTESAVLAALKWLARHQNANGGWSADGFGARCSGDKCGGPGENDYDAGVTGLALLAFLGSGYSTLSEDEFPDPLKGGTLKFGQVVDRGLRWLVAHQDRDGCVGERGMKYIYNHSIATIALCEARSMTRAEFLGVPARKATEFLVGSQNRGRAWRYSEKCGDNDTSVTSWAVMALQAAQVSSIPVPRAAFDGALAWLDEVSETSGYYRAGYTARGTGKVFVPGKNESFDDHPAMSAIAVAARLFIQRRKTEPALGAVNLLIADLPEWKANRIDFYYWHHATQAVFQYDGPEGAMWKRWSEPMKNALVPNQKTRKDGCQDGSWDPSGDRWGSEGGRVYATALNALTLETYYRYPVVCERK
jgi:hypothetical protein